MDTAKNDEDSSDSGKPLEVFNEAQFYAQILKFMQPSETVQQTLQRLGKGRVKISSAERLKRKKLGIIDEAGEKITKFTELTNEVLTKTGNMDIYQETYAQIKAKVNNFPTTSKGVQSAKSSKDDDAFDMYADDFEEKEQQRLKNAKNEHSENESSLTAAEEKPELIWEFKWKQTDSEMHGPYSTEQMQKWTLDKYFKDGVYVRKVGETSNFYSSNRIDFDLYL